MIVPSGRHSGNGLAPSSGQWVQVVGLYPCWYSSVPQGVARTDCEVNGYRCERIGLQHRVA
jgi:hypothetical protein